MSVPADGGGGDGVTVAVAVAASVPEHGSEEQELAEPVELDAAAAAALVAVEHRPPQQQSVQRGQQSPEHTHLLREGGIQQINTKKRSRTKRVRIFIRLSKACH
jgi:hypothetical protein